MAAAEAQDKHSELRAKLFAESLELSNQPRWGYFGLPGTLAIGDNSYAPRLMKKAKEETEAAEPIRNILTGPMKKGASTDVYFSFCPPMCIGDPYVDPITGIKKGKVTMLDPEAVFKPPGAFREPLNKLGYEYVPHMDSAKDPKEIKERYKDYMPPRQICTGPAKKGGGGVLTAGVLFGWGEDRKFPPHIPDDYDAAKKQRLAEHQYHKSKLQELPFKGIDYGNKTFQNNTEAFHYEVPTHVPREPKVENIKKYPHEAPFKPANPMKKGAIASLMGGVPEYIPDPVHQAPLRKKEADPNAPAAFRIGATRLVSKPDPSVVTLTRNMRAERPSSFMRPVL